MRLLGKIYLFVTPSNTNGRVPSQEGAPTTCNLTYWEVSQQTYVQTLLASLGVVIGQNSDIQSWYLCQISLQIILLPILIFIRAC